MRFIIILLLVPGTLICQQPVGHWRDHYPYLNAKDVISTTDKVFCIASTNLFYYDKRDGTMNKLSKVHGMSDINATAIGYDYTLKVLVVGYQNGNIDLVDKEGVFNISAIERKTITGSKRINNIYVKNSIAYLSTDFAIVVLNLENKEIKDTYFVGSNGEKSQILDITTDNNYIYALKKDAVLMADINSSFLIDFNQWHRYYSLNYNNAQYSNIENYSGNIYISLSVDGDRNDTLFVISNNKLQPIDLGFEADYYNLKTIDEKFIVSRTWSSVVLDNNMDIQKMYPAAYSNDADVDQDLTGWIADNNSGLIKIQGGIRDTIRPDGPRNKGSYRFLFNNGTMWVTGGSPSIQWSQYGIHHFTGQKWNTINYSVDTGLSHVYNISKLVVDPKDPTHVFGGSFGYGLVEFRDKKVIKVYNSDNSILKAAEGYEDSPNKNGFLRINGMDYDSKGNMYLALSESKNPFYVVTPEGKMINLVFKYDGFGIKTYIYDIMVSSSDHVWVLLKNNGIYIFDINGTPDDFSDDREKKINVINTDGESRNDVVSITEDNDNNIWVGTGNGPVIYYSHENIFDESNPLCDQVKLPDIGSQVQYLLVSDRISSIAIDGANRKWLGTESSGAYLVSPDGYHVIHSFRKENSPLPSNFINDIGIDDNTGEVFFGTDDGIISFRETATRGNSDFKNVYVFPNPVKSGYDGLITVTGLVGNVNVKFTDISGNIVFETTATGGQAVWNGKNFDGERVHTGVYLIFCTNDDGSKTYVTKMVFIH